jgi:hypothetical protein
MKAPKERNRSDTRLGAVAEAWARPRCSEDARSRLPRECPEREHYAHLTEEADLAHEVRLAAITLVWAGPIAWRRASHG